MREIDWKALAAPLPLDAIEWKIVTTGVKKQRGNDGQQEPWAKVLAYMTARAVQDRLDEVCGPANWQVKYEQVGGLMQCGIGIRAGDEWIWKWDGAGLMKASAGHLDESDAGKADFSMAQKRAAVQWGIGRYLYALDEAWANIHPRGALFGKTSQKQGSIPFRWDPPELPKWAQPGASAPPPPAARPPVRTQPEEEEIENVDTETGEIVEDEDLALIKARTLELINKVRADQNAMKLMKPGVLTKAENLLGGADMTRIRKAGDHLAEVLHEASQAGVR